MYYVQTDNKASLSTNQNLLKTNVHKSINC